MAYSNLPKSFASHFLEHTHRWWCWWHEKLCIVNFFVSVNEFVPSLFWKTLKDRRQKKGRKLFFFRMKTKIHYNKLQVQWRRKFTSSTFFNIWVRQGETLKEFRDWGRLRTRNILLWNKKAQHFNEEGRHTNDNIGLVWLFISIHRSTVVTRHKINKKINFQV